MPKKKLSKTLPSPSSKRSEVPPVLPPHPREPFIRPAPSDEPPRVKENKQALAHKALTGKPCPSCGKIVQPGSCDCVLDGALPSSYRKKRDQAMREFLGDLAARPFICEKCHGSDQPEWAPVRGTRRIRAAGDCPACKQHHVIALEAEGLAEVQRSLVAIYVLRRDAEGDLVEERIFSLRHIALICFMPEADRDHLSIQEVGGEYWSVDVRDATLAISAFERAEHFRALDEAQGLSTPHPPALPPAFPS